MVFLAAPLRRVFFLLPAAAAAGGGATGAIVGAVCKCIDVSRENRGARGAVDELATPVHR